MPLSDIFRSILKYPIKELLKSDGIRRRIIHELKANYFEDLEIGVPLGADFTCPFHNNDDAWSFSEIFVKSEYAPAFDQIPLPRRWLDLGCHIGYFSLLITWMRANRGLDQNFQALLVDADSRVEWPVNTLIGKNKLSDNLTFSHGLVASGEGKKSFFERTHMCSSVAAESPLAQEEKEVEIITPAKMFELLEPPYDLVKVDLEGAEYDFLTSYQPILQVTSYLLLEWHSWQRGGGSGEQIHQLAKENQFELVSEIVPAHDVNFEWTEAQCGVSLFKNNKLTNESNPSP